MKKNLKMHDVLATPSPTAARLDDYEKSWGELPSVSPHTREAPGYTTGKVLTDLSAAVDEIAALRAEVARLRAERGPLRPMSEAPKDRTPVIARIREDLLDVYPHYGFRSGDSYPGIYVVVRHPGVVEGGFDPGWSLAGPFGHGLGEDDCFAGWLPLPNQYMGPEQPPVAPETGRFQMVKVAQGDHVKDHARILIERFSSPFHYSDMNDESVSWPQVYKAMNSAWAEDGNMVGVLHAGMIAISGYDPYGDEELAKIEDTQSS